MKKKINNLGATDRIANYSAKVMGSYRSCEDFWQLSELSELQCMTKNPLWLRSCLGSLEPFEAVDHKLSPLSLERWKRVQILCYWCVSLEDHFSNVYCIRRANRKGFTHWEEWEMSQEGLEMSCCCIPHGDIEVKEAFCLTSTLKCHLPCPQLLSHLCTDCTRGSGWEVCLYK